MVTARPFLSHQGPQTGLLRIILQEAEPNLSLPYSSFSLLPTFSGSTPAALGCLPATLPPFRHERERLIYFSDIFACQMAQVGISSTCTLRSQHSSCSCIGFVWSGLFLLCKAQIFVDAITNALRPAAGLRGFLIDLSQLRTLGRC